MPNYFGPGRHLFLDCAVADPGSGGALAGGSASASGVAAALRADKKIAKYAPWAGSVSSQFRPAVIERFGACCDALVGFINMLCGTGERDALRVDDYSFSASSRTTYVASQLVFGSVIADAAMIERVIGMDVEERAHAGGGARSGRIGGQRAGQREVEGMGGRFWYELGA